jgi:hypothetical protein
MSYQEKPYDDDPDNDDSASRPDHARACPRAAGGGGERMLQHGKAGPAESGGHVAGRHHQHDGDHGPGAEGGKGTLTFQGRSYSFKLVGGVTGGAGAADTKATGEVYNLHNISDFKGLYTQSSAGAGLVTSGTTDLWLRNAAGVVLHLKGTQEGVSLSRGRGREEILIEML